MNATPQSHAFSKEEKSSLRHALTRLGRLPGKEAAAPVAEEPVRSPSRPCFSVEQADALVAQWFSRRELALQDADHGIFVSLISELPASSGTAIDVLAANRATLLERIETRYGDERHANLAQRLRRAIMLAAALHADPARRPWCDIAMLSAEKERLNLHGGKDLTDSEKEYLRFLTKVEDSGLLRRPCAVPDPAALMKLVARFPNFSAPLRFLAEQAALARLRGDTRFHAIPMLLSGPAGIGKTHFVTALAEALGSQPELVSMASATCGFALSGMDRGWSSARPGLVFTSLFHGQTLSPVIVLDEIDKANEEARSDPLGPLYSLLEYRTARAFRDEYAGIAVDASQVFWLATANDSRKLPAPLLSRFKVFEIDEPTAEQVATIAEQVYQDLSAGMPGAPAHLPPQWRSGLAGNSVRVIRLSLQEALGAAALRAVMSGQSGVTVQERDMSLPAGRQGRKIGFC